MVNKGEATAFIFFLNMLHNFHSTVWSNLPTPLFFVAILFDTIKKQLHYTNKKVLDKAFSDEDDNCAPVLELLWRKKNQVKICPQTMIIVGYSL